MPDHKWRVIGTEFRYRFKPIGCDSRQTGCDRGDNLIEAGKLVIQLQELAVLKIDL
jgi:hypothetical protein